MNRINAEQSINLEYRRLKNTRMKKGQTRKSLYEEAMSSYFAENYMLAFTGAYVYALIPIAINAKRLHKKKNKSKTPFEFNLSECLKECIFLSEDRKNELSKKYLITYERERDSVSKNLNWGFTRMRNVLLHPENYWNFFATKQLDFQKYALKMIVLAGKVHEEYKAYYKSPGKAERKQKERKIYKKIKKYYSAA